MKEFLTSVMKISSQNCVTVTQNQQIEKIALSPVQINLKKNVFDIFVQNVLQSPKIKHSDNRVYRKSVFQTNNDFEHYEQIKATRSGVPWVIQKEQENEINFQFKYFELFHLT